MLEKTRLSKSARSIVLSRCPWSSFFMHEKLTRCPNTNQLYFNLLDFPRRNLIASNPRVRRMQKSRNAQRGAESWHVRNFSRVKKCCLAYPLLFSFGLILGNLVLYIVNIVAIFAKKASPEKLSDSARRNYILRIRCLKSCKMHNCAVSSKRVFPDVLQLFRSANNCLRGGAQKGR